MRVGLFCYLIFIFPIISPPFYPSSKLLTEIQMKQLLLHSRDETV